MSLLSIENYLICLLFNFYYWKRGFQYSNCLERSQSQCILSGSCKRMIYVCLITLRKSVTGWDTTVHKMQAFLFLQLIVLMHFVPVEFLYWRLKDTTKKSKKKNALLASLGMRPDPDLELSCLQLAFRKLAFDICDFLDDLWLVFFHVFFLHLCVLFFPFSLSYFTLSFFLSFLLFIYFLKKQRVSECFVFFWFRVLVLVCLYTSTISFIWTFCIVLSTW